MFDLNELSGAFAGYASRFGQPDLSNDVVEKGAFQHSLVNKKTGQIAMLWQHDATSPIGTWQIIREDSQGLYVEGKLATQARQARDILALISAKALDGLSIGFRTVRSHKDPTTGLRHIKQADLWEISLVTFPMAVNARITQLKSQKCLSNLSANHGALPSVSQTHDTGPSKDHIINGLKQLSRQYTRRRF